ncbi:Ran BP2/NZF zinc finger-like superfamily protein [Striga asiatica]|uniref:Ran BP2/NZF zinc finger-like superfamily protein n=1 Tax=Striga asiatica TaxID=4170 RepID=A0A5A7R8T3_STRAF|nr:Ran BP2/NZF zinc finger-like superfamily protein [Striga asiatica]
MDFNGDAAAGAGNPAQMVKLAAQLGNQGPSLPNFAALQVRLRRRVHFHSSVYGGEWYCRSCSHCMYRCVYICVRSFSQTPYAYIPKVALAAAAVFRHLVVVPGAPGGPGAAAPVGVSPLVAVAVVVRPAAPVAGHVVPPHGAVTDVPAASELPARGLRLHHHLLIEVEGIGHKAVAVGLRHESLGKGKVAGVRRRSHGGHHHE